MSSSRDSRREATLGLFFDRIWGVQFGVQFRGRVRSLMPVGVVRVHVWRNDTRPVCHHRAGTFSEAHDAERAECCCI